MSAPERTAESAGGERPDGTAPVGWPEPAPSGGGDVGWPGELPREAGRDQLS